MDENRQIFIDKVLDYLQEKAKPLTVSEIEEDLQVTEAEDFKSLVKALVYMEEQGMVVRTRSNRYGLPEKMNLTRKDEFECGELCQGIRKVLLF